MAYIHTGMAGKKSEGLQRIELKRITKDDKGTEFTLEIDPALGTLDDYQLFLLKYADGIIMMTGDNFRAGCIMKTQCQWGRDAGTVYPNEPPYFAAGTSYQFRSTVQYIDNTHIAVTRDHRSIKSLKSQSSKDTQTSYTKDIIFYGFKK